MTQYEMTERLAEKCDVTLEEAKNALDAGDWNVLTATHLLEQERFRRMQALNAIASAGEAVAVQAAPDAGAADGNATEASAVNGSATNESAARQAVTIGTVDEAGRAGGGKRCRGRGHKNLGDHIRRLVACGNRNRLEVRRGGESLLELPVTVLVVLLLCAFWVCVPLLVIGLFAGCRYSFGGKELGRGDINRALDKVADAADRAKRGMAKA